MRAKWRLFRQRWPSLPLAWKAAIIGLGLISVLDTIRLVVNLVRGSYW